MTAMGRLRSVDAEVGMKSAIEGGIALSTNFTKTIFFLAARVFRGTGEIVPFYS